MQSVLQNLLDSRKDGIKKLFDEYKKIKHPFSYFNPEKIVRPSGNFDSKLVFLGEGPGAEEERLLVPFVGKAGQLLTKIIEAMGFSRQDVLITNVVKCRLPENRTPTDEEILVEKKLILDQEFKIYGPRVICTLGAVATKAMLGLDAKISKTRGKFHSFGSTLIMPTYHPAYLLRNPSAKRLVWEDVKKIVNILEKDSEHKG